MAEPIRWLALGYSVPVNPSKNRVYVWRKLKEYGAEYFKQGVALLPYNRQSYTRFKYLLGKIVEFVKERGLTEKVNIEAAFSSRPEADGTIAVTVSDIVIPRNDSVEQTLKSVKQAIESTVSK